MVRPIDHLVLPVSGLETARRRCQALGFTVAPDGRHPFGTVNACVYLRGGSYLEPLAIGDPEAADAAGRAGNVFITRDRLFRQVHGTDGFSAVALATGDADGDDARFRQAGFSAGPVLGFERPFVDAAGKSDSAAFRLAFAAEPGTDGLFAFTCARLNAPAVDRSALERHENGVAGLAGVLLAAAAPHAHRAFLETAAGTQAHETPDGGLAIDTGRGSVEVETPAVLAARYGIETAAQKLSALAVCFSVADLQATEALFKAHGILYQRREACLRVARAPGQGTEFLFEAA